MVDEIRKEFDKVVRKRDEVKKLVGELEAEDPQDAYNIRINRDRLAYWEGRVEGLKFALDHLESSQ